MQSEFAMHLLVFTQGPTGLLELIHDVDVDDEDTPVMPVVLPQAA